MKNPVIPVSSLVEQLTTFKQTIEQKVAAMPSQEDMAKQSASVATATNEEKVAKLTQLLDYVAEQAFFNGQLATINTILDQLANSMDQSND